MKERIYEASKTIKRIYVFLKYQRKNKWTFTYVVPSVPMPRVSGQDIDLTRIAHACFLIQTDNTNIITDPIYARRAGPMSAIGPKRNHNPGIEFSALPPIDVVLLSHDHYDHWNTPTLKRLYKRFNPLFVIPKHAEPILYKVSKNIRFIALQPYESCKVGNLAISLVPAYHWSRRYLKKSDPSLYGSYVIETKTKPIYFAGDTGFDNGDYFREIYKKFGSMRLALIPIGAYLPESFQRYHINPYQAVQIHNILHAHTSIAMHYDTYKLSLEKYGQAEQDLYEALKTIPHKGQFITIKLGNIIHIP